ncbi:MAG: hypothetical protein UR67_C0007G0063 [candidate division CPR3 bacterium GW2011_GWF2_35_18]|uniref:Methyltransferase domain-containing protein n=1 Tax=candidate division CPR3 bacterium GW2011_GWF2_35_18 TaxID=1618350 RepID=A0A0G0BIV3_UNCC3|nr:MAG: hypothetical protein UR67_C0007G0063 [candidate division CPR3 bacterium GW2011_GWF2_35_18]
MNNNFTGIMFYCKVREIRLLLNMNNIMRNFNAKQYYKLFEDWDDPVIKSHEKDEFKLIREIKNLEKKTIIDLGAGYGRILKTVSPLVKQIVGIDVNPEMFKELEKRANVYPNVTVLKEDVTYLSKLLKARNIVVHKPLLLCLQNTLGTIEGDWQKVLQGMKKVGKKYQGEIILSLYRQQALRDWGLMTYYHGSTMNGEPDLSKCNFDKGWFESKTGYTSKWWTDEEIKKLQELLGGENLQEIKTAQYYIIYLKYS